MNNCWSRSQLYTRVHTYMHAYTQSRIQSSRRVHVAYLDIAHGSVNTPARPAALNVVIAAIAIISAADRMDWLPVAAASDTSASNNMPWLYVHSAQWSCHPGETACAPRLRLRQSFSHAFGPHCMQKTYRVGSIHVNTHTHTITSTHITHARKPRLIPCHQYFMIINTL